MKSQHEYTAFLIGTPDIEIDVHGGTVTLDAGRAPHVQASLTVPADQIDPRTTPRIRIEVDATVGDVAQARTFDLGVRAYGAPESDGTVALDLASDEALLGEYAPLADDDAPLSLESSLRDIVDYVLDTAIPGAALEAGADVDMKRYWAVTNLVANATGNVDATHWIFGTGGSTPSAITMTSPLPPIGSRAITWQSTGAAESNMIPTTAAYRVTPGRWYVFAAYVCTAGTARTARAAIQWWGETGAVIAGTVVGSTVVSDATQFRRPFVIAQAPPGAQSALPYVSVLGAAAGQDHFTAIAMFYEGSYLIPPYLGGSPDGDGYSYQFQGDPDASPATRTPDVERLPEALIWRAGQTALDFLAPLVQAEGLRLVCDEARSWTLRDETYTAAGALNIRYGVNLHDGEARISRDSGLWFDAAVTRYRWTDADGVQHERIDAYALNDPYTKLRLFEEDTAYPGPGFSEYAVRRAQGRGREVTATIVSDWRAHAEQPVTVRLSSGPIQTGITQSVTYDFDTDRMTVNTRSTDTPDDAWVLIAPDEAWLDSPVGESWTEESI